MCDNNLSATALQPLDKVADFIDKTLLLFDFNCCLSTQVDNAGWEGGSVLQRRSKCSYCFSPNSSPPPPLVNESLVAHCYENYAFLSYINWVHNKEFVRLII